jgi:hypothetical protein
MWNWFNCYLSGRHDYGMWCEPGTIFLRCVHCGRRSSGWAVNGQPVSAPKRSTASSNNARAAHVPFTSRILRFDRRVAS